MPFGHHNGVANYNYPAIGSTWSAITMQRFEDRAACEHAAKQIRAMQGVSHDIRMTCQPAQLEGVK